MSWKDKLHDAVFTEEAPAPAPEHPVLMVKKEATLGPTQWRPEAPLRVAAMNQRYYAALLAKTDLALTPTLSKVMEFAVPLESIIADRTVRMKAAAAQAKADAAVMASEVNRLQDYLKAESVAFKAELEQKKKDLAVKQEKVAALRSQLQAAEDELSGFDQVASRAESEFGVAYNQRESELKQLAQESSTWR